MRKKILYMAVGMAIGTLTNVISGCATNRIDLADRGVVSVETVPGKRVNILWTDVYQDGEDLVIYGVVQRHSHSSYPIKTHVDVNIFAPDGTVLQQTRTPDIYVPRRLAGKGISWKRFEVRLPTTPPRGSLVRIVSHSGLHNEST